jgi:hypothetical protein
MLGATRRETANLRSYEAAPIDAASEPPVSVDPTLGKTSGLYVSPVIVR